MARSLLNDVLHRLEYAGLREDVPTLNLLADVFNLSVQETNDWTNRADDAMRIPDVLYDVECGLREEARRLPHKPEWSKGNKPDAANG